MRTLILMTLLLSGCKGTPDEARRLEPVPGVSPEDSKNAALACAERLTKGTLSTSDKAFVMRFVETGASR